MPSWIKKIAGIFVLVTIALIFLSRRQGTGKENIETPYVEGKKSASGSLSDTAPASQTASRFRSEIFQTIEKRKAEIEKENLRKTPNDATSATEDNDGRTDEKNTFLGKAGTKELLAAVQEDPDDVAILSRLSDMMLGEDVQKARHYAIECLARDEKNSVCHRTLISTFTRYGQFDDAFPYLSDCLEIDRNNVHCLGGMINYQLQKGDLDEARRLTEHLSRIDPDSIWTHLAMGSYYDAAGNSEAALEHFRKACKRGQPYACRRSKEAESHHARRQGQE